MPIVSSIIVEDRAQAGGRRHVREVHTDHVGGQHGVSYMAEEGANAGTTMAARVALIESQLADAELQRNEGRALEGPFVAPTFVHCTAAQARQRIREIYKVATAFVVCRLAWYIQRLGLSDNQLKNLFGVNDAQLVAVKSKLASLEQKYLDVSDEVGE